MRFQQNLLSRSPAFRMPETYRKIGESTFAVHPQVCNCSFVYLETFPLYSQSYLQPTALRFWRQSPLLQICVFHLLPQLCYAHPLREFYNLSLSTQSILDSAASPLCLCSIPKKHPVWLSFLPAQCSTKTHPTWHHFNHPRSFFIIFIVVLWRSSFCTSGNKRWWSGNLSASRSRESSRCSSKCLPPCQSAGATGVPSSCPPPVFFHVSPRRRNVPARLACCTTPLWAHSPVAAVSFCATHLRRPLKYLLLLLDSQSEVCRLPCCTQPAWLALRPSFGSFKTREFVLKIVCRSFSMSTTCCVWEGRTRQGCQGPH